MRLFPKDENHLIYVWWKEENKKYWKMEGYDLVGMKDDAPQVVKDSWAYYQDYLRGDDDGYNE